MPLPPGQPARRKAVGAGPLLSMPGFCVTPLRHSRQLSTRDGDVAGHRGHRQHPRREPAAAAVHPVQPPPERRPMHMIVVAAPVPLPPPATGQPARDGDSEVEESRRVCAPSETTHTQIHSHTNISKAAIAAGTVGVGTHTAIAAHATGTATPAAVVVQMEARQQR